MGDSKRDQLVLRNSMYTTAIREQAKHHIRKQGKLASIPGAVDGHL